MKIKLIASIIFAVILCGCSKESAKDNKKEQSEIETSKKKKNDSALTKEMQTNLTIEQIIQQFHDGNDRFLKDETIQNDYIKQVEQTGKEGQYPKAIVLSCIDSRAPVEAIFDKGIGEIFGTRVAGNYADAGVIGGIEYACKVAGAKLIIVMGHSDCGAVKSACDNVKLGNITDVMNEIKPAVDSVKGFTEERNSKNKQFVTEVTDKNVDLTIKEILSKSEIITELVNEGKVKIIGALYDVKTGKVEFKH